jgi:hypothetical protein
MQIFITDTTLKPAKDVVLNDYNQAVKYLEGIAQRKFGCSRRDHMLLLESIGYGGDDNQSVTFVRSMAEHFQIGIVRDGRKVHCDIVSAFVFNKPEYGS